MYRQFHYTSLVQTWVTWLLYCWTVNFDSVKQYTQETSALVIRELWLMLEERGWLYHEWVKVPWGLKWLCVASASECNTQFNGCFFRAHDCSWERILFQTKKGGLCPIAHSMTFLRQFQNGEGMDYSGVDSWQIIALKHVTKSFFFLLNKLINKSSYLCFMFEFFWITTEYPCVTGV